MATEMWYSYARVFTGTLANGSSKIEIIQKKGRQVEKSENGKNHVLGHNKKEIVPAALLYIYISPAVTVLPRLILPEAE